jgi:hypothetical protein
MTRPFVWMLRSTATLLGSSTIGKLKCFMGSHDFQHLICCIVEILCCLFFVGVETQTCWTCQWRLSLQIGITTTSVSLLIEQ